MSNIPATSMPWNDNATDGSNVTAAIWNQAMQTLVTAINDNYTRILNITNAQSTVLVATGNSYPSTPSNGQQFYRTDLAQMKMYNGTTWVDTESTVNAANNLIFSSTNYAGATAATANTVALRDGAGGLAVAGLTASSFGGSAIVPIANGGTGSATQNFVDLTSAQNITGAKTFTATGTDNGLDIINVGTLHLDPNAGNSSFNPIVQAGDLAIIGKGSTSSNGNLVLAPWSSTKGGIRLTNNGAVTTANNTIDDGIGNVVILKNIFTNNGVGVNGGNVHYFMRSNTGVNRIGIGLNNAEGTGHTGSDFAVWSYDNTGAFVATILDITRDGKLTSKNNTLDNGSGGQTIIADTNYLATQSGAAKASPGIVLQGWNGSAAVGGRIYGQSTGGWYSSNWANNAVTFQVDDSGNGTFAGALTINGSGGSFANSKAQNGYQKLPGGLIIQWGSVTTGNSATAITFPTAFPTALASISVCSSTYQVWESSPSATGFTLSMGVSPTSITMYWTAIGY